MLRISEAAEQLGLSIATVRKLFRQGKLTGFSYGTTRATIRLDQDSVTAFKKGGDHVEPRRYDLRKVLQEQTRSMPPRTQNK